MKQDGTDHEEMYYVTKVFTSADDHQLPCGKEMDSAGTLCALPYEATLPGQYENGGPQGQIILHYVEEEVSYMADYVANDAEEIQTVRYHAVPSGHMRRKTLILQPEGRAPDTP